SIVCGDAARRTSSTCPAETRFSQPVAADSNRGGGNAESTILLVLALAAIIAGIIIAASGNDGNSPN
ncbi:MAG: hypothetical protein IE917_17410, partial [Betaproteobacteria bacterium]|nr:hypothetical protein [Betaproteobacteria bacterium]